MKLSPNSNDYRIVACLSCALAAAAVWLGAQTPAGSQISEAARSLHTRSLVFDGHVHAADREFYHGGDIDRIRKSGKMAAVLDIEGSFDLDGDLAVLREMHRLGLRSAQLSAHNWTSNYADSCCSKPASNGLNDRGRAVVREMNRLGMV